MPVAGDIYKPITSEILEVIEESPTIKTFVLKPSEKIPFEAGQFMEVTVPGLGEAPFTPSSNPKVTETLEFTIMRAGRVTGVLHTMKKGDTVGVRGPMGKGYPLDLYKGKEILIVGGGVGLAPLRSLFLALTNRLDDFKKILFCYGAKTPQDMIYKPLILDQWPRMNPAKIEFRLSVDIGDPTWKGNVGVVTTVVKDLGLDMAASVAVVCGPPIMMKFATLKLVELGFPDRVIYLSMEKNMSCGIGKCGHCMLGQYMVCKDGPVLTYDKIKGLPALWD
ncbi:MAG TPA: FAD/NAD(P)-binding protein [bacterium]|nr:FAD/NAD(P)-binding protein [bacterium]